jgi:hypothetical protein
VRSRAIPDVVQCEQKMRGGSQSNLVRASDGCRYVLKMFDNPEGNDNLFHEALGSGLAQVVGLPVPSWRPLSVSETFIDQNPQLWFESGGQLTRPTAGLHYGSAFVQGKNGGETYQIVPASWHPRLVNSGDFLGMLLFDLWTDHSENRQALFVEMPATRQLKAVFIDHGRMFGHTDSLRRRVGRTRFLDTRVYSLCSSVGLLPAWQKRIENVGASTISYLMNTVPISWKRAGYSEAVLSRLLEAQARIADNVCSIRALLEEGDSLIINSGRDLRRRTGPCHTSNLDKLRTQYAISPA